MRTPGRRGQEKDKKDKRQEDDGEDKIFSGDLPFAPPPRAQVNYRSWQYNVVTYRSSP